MCAFLEANGHDCALFEEYKVDGAALMAMTDADVRNLTGMQPHTLDRLRSDMRRSFADYREGAGADGAARPPTPAPTVDDLFFEPIVPRVSSGSANVHRSSTAPVPSGPEDPSPSPGPGPAAADADDPSPSPRSAARPPISRIFGDESDDDTWMNQILSGQSKRASASDAKDARSKSDPPPLPPRATTRTDAPLFDDDDDDDDCFAAAAAARAGNESARRFESNTTVTVPGPAPSERIDASPPAKPVDDPNDDSAAAEDCDRDRVAAALEAARRREAEVAERETAVSDREAAASRREAELERRAAALDEREAAIAAVEAAAADKTVAAIAREAEAMRLVSTATRRDAAALEPELTAAPTVVPSGSNAVEVGERALDARPAPRGKGPRRLVSTSSLVA